MTEQEMRRLILAASQYRSGTDSVNSVYMGSVQTANVMHALGGKYGQHGMAQLLDAASAAQLREAMTRADSIIRYMQQHPMKLCPCCGQAMPANAGPGGR